MSASAVLLKGEELEVARAEVGAVRDVVQDGSYREALDGLIARLDDGEPLSGSHAEELDRVITLALQSGRVRALYGPGGEQAALRAFRKLPTGAELTASAAQVNDALAALAGRPLDRVSVSAVGPGAFTIAIAADGAELSIRLDRQGARLASVGL